MKLVNRHGGRIADRERISSPNSTNCHGGSQTCRAVPMNFIRLVRPGGHKSPLWSPVGLITSCGGQRRHRAIYRVGLRTWCVAGATVQPLMGAGASLCDPRWSLDIFVATGASAAKTTLSTPCEVCSCRSSRSPDEAAVFAGVPPLPRKASRSVPLAMSKVNSCGGRATRSARSPGVGAQIATPDGVARGTSI